MAAVLPRAAGPGLGRRHRGEPRHRARPVQGGRSATHDVAHDHGVRPGTGHRADSGWLAAGAAGLALGVRLFRAVRRADAGAGLAPSAREPAAGATPALPPARHRRAIHQLPAPPALRAADPDAGHRLCRLLALHRLGLALHHGHPAPEGNRFRLDVHPAGGRPDQRLGHRQPAGAPPVTPHLCADRLHHHGRGGHLQRELQPDAGQRGADSVGGAAAVHLLLRPVFPDAGRHHGRDGLLPAQPGSGLLAAIVHADGGVCHHGRRGGAAAVRQRAVSGAGHGGYGNCEPGVLHPVPGAA